MTRREMIKALVEHEIEVNFSNMSFIRDVIHTGYVGYDMLTDEEIKSEYDYIQKAYDSEGEIQDELDQMQHRVDSLRD